MPKDRARYEGQGIKLGASVRTPEQVIAFYSARGFPGNAVQALAEKCLVTIGMRHGRKEPVWLEPKRWRFIDSAGKPITRLDRDYWNARFAQLNVPMASRSTFGWTQLPESRDLRSGEPVGGNVVIEPPAGTFHIEMRFPTGADRSGPELVVRLNDLHCPRISSGDSQEQPSLDTPP